MFCPIILNPKTHAVNYPGATPSSQLLMMDVDRKRDFKRAEKLKCRSDGFLSGQNKGPNSLLTQGDDRKQ